MKKVLVLGYYWKNNLGDQLFIDALKFLFPILDLTFVNHISLKDINNFDTIFIGGGSFLNESLDIEDGVFNLLKTKNIFYLGVGAETDFHPQHQELLKLAKLIAIRSDVGLSKVKLLNSKIIVISDLVNVLTPTISANKFIKSILFLPNASTTPTWNFQHWQHAAWNYFKSECAQFLDFMVEEGFTIKFFPFSTDDKINDSYAAIEIINSMSHRKNDYLITSTQMSFSEATELFSQFNLIISQRFHGIILADMINVPCLSIYHHDKLKSSCSLSFYGLTKDALKKSVKDLIVKEQNMSLDLHCFEEMKQRVNQLL